MIQIDKNIISQFKKLYKQKKPPYSIMKSLKIGTSIYVELQRISGVKVYTPLPRAKKIRRTINLFKSGWPVKRIAEFLRISKTEVETILEDEFLKNDFKLKFKSHITQNLWNYSRIASDVHEACKYFSKIRGQKGISTKIVVRPIKKHIIPFDIMNQNQFGEIPA